MSLPFLLSRGSTSTTSSNARFRTGSKGASVAASAGKVGASRGSTDTEHRGLIGNKRAITDSQSDVAPARLAWEHLLDPCAAACDIQSLRLPRVCVCGLSELGRQLADCLLSKAGFAQLGVHDECADLSQYSILPGVSAHECAVEACAWADLVILCGSYEEGTALLSDASAGRQLRGKCVLHLANGAPQEAADAAAFVRSLGAKYLDACLLSESHTQTFGRRGSSLMVCGDKAAWNEFSSVVKAFAPAAFFGGRMPEQANAVGVAICTFMTSVYMGLQQSLAITSRYGVPAYLLPRLLAGSFMPVVKRLVQGGAPPLANAISHSRAPSASLGNATPSFAATAASTPTASASTAEVCTAQPAAGTPAWRAQLERIQRVCREAGIEHDIIDGFLASPSCGGTGSGAAAAAAAAALPAAPASSARHGAKSDCLDSWVDSAVGPAQGAKATVPRSMRGKVVSALDLLDFDAFGATGAAVSELGAELMDVCFEGDARQVAWAP